MDKLEVSPHDEAKVLEVQDEVEVLVNETGDVTLSSQQAVTGVLVKPEVGKSQEEIPPIDNLEGFPQDET
jgi:hypothetical protein